MQAISLQEPGRFQLIDIPEPPAPGPGQALARVHCVGICGTDISGYLGKMPFFSYPRIPGHELGVEVLAVGDDVSNVQPGDRCSVEPYLNDSESFASVRGRPNCCENLRVLGVHVDGGLRPRFLLPARKLHPGGPLSFEQLALVETLAIGCHAVDRAAPRGDDHLLVIGAGPIGLGVIVFAQLAGAQVTVLDLNPDRLAFCRSAMNVAHTVQLTDSESAARSLADITAGHLFPTVIDATGHAPSMSAALEHVGHTGRLVYVGITTGQVTFPHPLMHRREMTLLASRNALPGDFARIISLIEQGRIDTRPWITHRGAFGDLIDRFDAYTRPESGVIKAMVDLSDLADAR